MKQLYNMAISTGDGMRHLGPLDLPRAEDSVRDIFAACIIDARYKYLSILVFYGDKVVASFGVLGMKDHAPNSWGVKL